MQKLSEQLAEIVTLPCPKPTDLTLEGLCKWAPPEVVQKVRREITLVRIG